MGRLFYISLALVLAGLALLFDMVEYSEWTDEYQTTAYTERFEK